MKTSPDEHVFYNIMNAKIDEYPFPHMFLRNIFDPETYENILSNLPDNKSFGSIADSPHIIAHDNKPPMYEDRFIIDMDEKSFSVLPDQQKKFWLDFSSWFLGNEMINMLVNKFSPQLHQRFKDSPNQNIRVNATGLITRDTTGFSIGPHTDTDQKVLTLLYYLPKDLSQVHLGTSIYVARDPNFKGAGGVHYTTDGFKKVFTAPFEPNSLFCFMKTDQSFHGVEMIENENIERNLLIYNMKLAI